ncbi:hypothetical protein Tco_1502601 [Tanacetum coccineum]
MEYAPTVNQQQQQPEFPQLDLGLTIPVFKQGDDPIDSINHMMSFLSAVVTSRYPTTNNQLRNSSNPRQQATINDGRVTLRHNRRDLPRDIPLDNVVVLRYEKRSKSENKGKVPTEMELVLEQPQQEHQSDIKVFTMTMEILLDPTSNKLMVDSILQLEILSRRFFFVGKYELEGQSTDKSEGKSTAK